MRDVYQTRRDYVVKRLSEIGFNYIYPTGAFYIFVQLPQDFQGTSWDFATRLAHEAQVAVVPGSAFGTSGEGWFRISYAASQSALREGLNRLALWRAQTTTQED